MDHRKLYHYVHDEEIIHDDNFLLSILSMYVCMYVCMYVSIMIASDQKHILQGCKVRKP